MIYYLQTTTWNQYRNITAIADLHTWLVMYKFYNEYITDLHDEHYQELKQDHDQDDSSVKMYSPWNRTTSVEIVKFL